MVAGCSEVAEKPSEDQNPHFQKAQALISVQDYKGAIDEFEKALETNPQSAATHFELGWLCENDRIRDYAAAIYHYKKHLQLKPDSDRAAQINERLRACRIQMANGEFPLPTSQNLQKEVDRVTAENVALKQQLESLRVQLATAQLTQSNLVAQRTSTGGSTTTQITPLPRIYKIQDGDTISGIASRFKLKSSAVLAANPKIKPEKLRIGQTINLPLQ